MTSLKTAPKRVSGATDRFFHITEQGTTFRTELVAGVTTFLAMAYILFVNPQVLGSAGMDVPAVFVATALAAALGSLVMGLWARYPIAMAPGMGLNAFFAFTVVLGMGIPWETALAGTLVSGVLFFILAVTGVRGAIIRAIPLNLKFATGAGIGLFIAFIGLRNAEIVVPDEATTVTLGDLSRPETLLALFGVAVTAVFLIRGFKGGVFYGMILTAAAGMVTGLISAPDAVVGSVPSLAPTFGVAFGSLGDLVTTQMIVVVLTMLFVDFFDTSGTLIAVANQAGFLKNGELPRANRALMSDSVATMGGAVLGTSTTTSYIESSAGVSAGGRTGLTSVVTAGFFLLSLLFSPLLAVVTPEVTAPALIIVGVFMAKALGDIEWNKLEYAIPAFATVVAMPLTYSIANGIAFGLLLYPLLMVAKGRWRDVHPITYALFVVVIAHFIWLV
ncbi:NCS2 family permease [Hoyosella altamirensis]|uniref:AGZA family xanthine/uracil permease-like MFS transporter n=1 Tax=Hoyosella altamirensis TaxID=616997 RepID=A0A839RQA0_9ACTN|nr:NCS2 family permease [Hoyosella altamirensis]MBB3038398.1 AGZA family xanthine/uracil permease-like MFS transporter [Hoyosella altamirensis]